MIAALTLIAQGLASWFTPYQSVYIGGYFCAMNTVASGHKVRIVAGRYHQNCTIIGTGPFVAGRVIDVSPLVRDSLHMESSGVVPVRVYLIR